LLASALCQLRTGIHVARNAAKLADIFDTGKLREMAFIPKRQPAREIRPKKRMRYMASVKTVRQWENHLHLMAQAKSTDRQFQINGSNR